MEKYNLFQINCTKGGGTHGFGYLTAYKHEQSKTKTERY